MDKQKIEQLTEDVVKVANGYIDKGMNTEDVYGALCGAGFLVVKASKNDLTKQKAVKSAVEENLDVN